MRGAEVGRDGLELVADRPQDQAVADDQGDQPGGEQGDGDRRREQAEHRVVGAAVPAVTDRRG